MAETLPIINGSSGTWGSILNTAIGNIDQKLADAVAKNTAQDTTLTTYGQKITALENKSTVGLLAISTSANRPPPSVGLMGMETDTGYLYYCASVGGVATRVPWPGSFLAKIKQTSSQNLPNNLATTITFQAADTNRLGGWSGGGAYIAQVPGVYEFSGSVSFVFNTTGDRSCLFYLNDATFNGTGTRIPAANLASTIVNARTSIMTLAVGDKVELRGLHTSGATLATDIVNLYPQSGIQVKYLGYYGS